MPLIDNGSQGVRMVRTRAVGTAGGVVVRAAGDGAQAVRSTAGARCTVTRQLATAAGPRGARVARQGGWVVGSAANRIGHAGPELEGR